MHINCAAYYFCVARQIRIELNIILAMFLHYKGIFAVQRAQMSSACNWNYN